MTVFERCLYIDTIIVSTFRQPLRIVFYYDTMIVFGCDDDDGRDDVYLVMFWSVFALRTIVIIVTCVIIVACVSIVVQPRSGRLLFGRYIGRRMANIRYDDRQL